LFEGIATPIDEAIRRLGSWVACSASTQWTIAPGRSIVLPLARGTTLQFGGKMLETRTRLYFSICASRSAFSNDCSFSLCVPTPL
jgi:hypothetical protein